MVTTIIILLILSLIFNIFLVYINKKLKTQSQTMASLINGMFHDISARIEYSARKLHEIDVRGSFSSDDEVGYFFKEVQGIQEILNEFNQNYFIDVSNERDQKEKEES